LLDSLLQENDIEAHHIVPVQDKIFEFSLLPKFLF